MESPVPKSNANYHKGFEINSPLGQVSTRTVDLLSSHQTSHQSTSHQSKSSNQSYIRTTFYLPRHLHKQLKIVAAHKDRDMSGIIEELLESWLKNESKLFDLHN
jgi:hypothetical protein